MTLFKAVVSRVLLAMTVAFLLTVSARAAEPIYTRDGLGLAGFDAVAYFTDGRPVKGSERFEYVWRGVRWHFASAAHRDAFAASPERYTPRYGGYCAYAVSRNKLAPADPEAWKIVAGRLYVNVSKDVRALWEKELPDAIQRADRNWPGVLENPAH